MEPEKKKASPYSICKEPVETHQISRLHRALNKQTNEIWFAKVFDMEEIEKNGLQDHLQFNETVLLELQEAGHIVHTNEIIIKNNSTIFIEEEWQQTLINYVKTESPLPVHVMSEILREVFEGLLEVYEAGYYHKNLRPEHIVCVDDVWKIESFVLNTDKRPVKSEICWSNKYISPEERKKGESLQSQKVDEQIVWQLGIIGLYMIFGDTISYEITKDTDIDWKRVQENADKEMFEVISSCLKVKFQERIRIRALARLALFSDLCEGKVLPFLSESKFFLSSKKGPQMVESVMTMPPEEEEKFKKQVNSDFSRFLYFGDVEYYIQNLPYTLTYDLTVVRYSTIQIGLINLKKIHEQFKAIQLGISPQLTKLMESISNAISKMEQSTFKYHKFITNSTEAKKSILLNSTFQKEIKDTKIPVDTLKNIFNSVAGAIYSELRLDCQKKYNQQKERTICYFSLAAYLSHFNEEKDLKKIPEEYQENGKMNFGRWIQQGNLDSVVELTQELVQKYFAVS